MSAAAFRVSARPTVRLVLLMALLASPSSNVLARQDATPPAATAPSSDRSTPIDFDSVARVPDELRDAIGLVIERSAVVPANVTSLTITSFRQDGDWAFAVAADNRVIAEGWEIGGKDRLVFDLLLRREAGGPWRGAVAGDPAHAELARAAPGDAPPDGSSVTAQVSQTYLFPWTSGQRWYKTQGWHNSFSANALDFQPVARSNPAVHFSVLAAASGVLSEQCNDGSQAILKVVNSDGPTYYLHLAANSVRRDLYNRNVPRGQFIGLLYNPGGGFSSACGYGTAFHLHVELPTRSMTIDGYAANAVSSAPFATPYLSTNLRSDAEQSVQPRSLSLSKEKSAFNGWVAATLAGFAPNSGVTLRWPRAFPAGAPVSDELATGTSDGSGRATFRFRTPMEPYGTYTVTARDASSGSATADLRVIPRILLSDTSGPAGFAPIRVFFYGFSPGERVQVEWYPDSTMTGTPSVLTTVTIAADGRARSDRLTIPTDAVNGRHMVRGKVIGVSRSVSATFTVSGPAARAAPAPTPTRTATVVGTGGRRSPTPTTTAIASATSTPSPTAPDAPTLTTTPPETQTPTPTETPTKEPTGTPTPEPPPTETATSTPEAPAEAGVPEADTVPAG